MSLAIAFWVCLLLFVILGGYINWPGTAGPYTPIGNALLCFLLFLIAGIKLFGPPLQ